MTSDIAISVKNVSKYYQVFGDQLSRLVHAFTHKKTSSTREVAALSGINFEIRRGEAVAIIGRNGSGKSTLLEILTGTLTPTTGEVKVNGRVSALLELGSGFNPDYSGRDNVILNGLLLGLTKVNILNRFAEIEAFAEIGEAIDQPVKTYSSGMMMRLAFAVQVLCDPDILIVDEALSVGDFFFQQKCFDYIRGLLAKGVTLLFVSHDMGTVRDLCARVIYLRKGKLVFDGSSSKGILAFFNEQSFPNTERTAPKDTAAMPMVSNYPEQDVIKNITNDAIWSTQAMGGSGKIISVTVYDIKNIPTMFFTMGDKMLIKILFAPSKNHLGHISVAIKDKFGMTITSTGGLQLSHDDEILKKGYEKILFELEIDLMIEAGEYSLFINLGYETGKNRGIVIDEIKGIGPFQVVWDYENKTAPFLGKVGLPSKAKYKNY